jgi:hypothetical protein
VDLVEAFFEYVFSPTVSNLDRKCDQKRIENVALVLWKVIFGVD